MAKSDPGHPTVTRLMQLQSKFCYPPPSARRDPQAHPRRHRELNGMRFSYQLTNGGGRGGAKLHQSDPTRPSPICKFTIVPHHDARSHRSQGKGKRPFTADELKQLGLSKVQLPLFARRN